MTLSIATNMAAHRARHDLFVAHQDIANSAAHLASGFRISRAADDAAGLTITTDLTLQLSGLAQSVSNAHSATTIAATADSALATVGDTLQRMWQLIIAASNDGAHSEASLRSIAHEVGALTELLDAIAEFTASGATKLLDGHYIGNFSVGGDAAGIVVLDLSSADVHAHNLGGGPVGGGIDLTALSILEFARNAGHQDGAEDDAQIYSANGVRADLAALTESIRAISDRRSAIGGVQRQLDYHLSDLRTAITALTQTRSHLADADMAEQAGKYLRGQILATAATAVLAQANSAPKAVLRLLDAAGAEASERTRGYSASPGAGSSDSDDDRSPSRLSGRSDARTGVTSEHSPEAPDGVSDTSAASSSRPAGPAVGPATEIAATTGNPSSDR